MNPPTLRSHKILRVAVASPRLQVGAMAANSEAIAEVWKKVRAEGAELLITPELSLCGYTIADLLYQEMVQQHCLETLAELARLTAAGGWLTVGLPILWQGRLYNATALLGDGKVIGVVPKIHLPNRHEYYERRWFVSGREVRGANLSIGEETVPFGVDLLFAARDFPALVLGLEICEDLWAVEPPSGKQALAGATVLANGSASNEILGKAAYRRSLVAQQSARCLAAYLYASSGPGESTTDLVYSGAGLIAENGRILANAERFSFATTTILADLDLGQLQHERLRNSSFAEESALPYRRVSLPLGETVSPAQDLRRPNPPLPFVPDDPARRAEHCREIFSIQQAGLAKRLQHLGNPPLVVGLSGGLDSTLALLVSVAVFDQLKVARKKIIAPTLPGFGTTGRTRGNAEKLVELLGVTGGIIPIEPAVRQHFQDIGHDESQHDVTYENSQARERTQILMDLANKHGGICLGTGDLSESALGWCTFNGDHMSMYHVNIGVPKTLVRYLIQYCAEEFFTGPICAILQDIVDTPITPELLPLAKDGALAQMTEETVGPYELHDYFLYAFVRHGFPPRKILFLASQAFAGKYDPDVIKTWLRVFLKRFFSQQFKRSAMPDGPKVGSVALSPRGDWRMPSDACGQDWWQELD